MSHCTTWHVRIDLVDEGSGVSARARLIGAPSAMSPSQERSHDGCLAGCDDIEYLSVWRPVADLAPALVDALFGEHRASAPLAHPAAAPHTG